VTIFSALAALIIAVLYSAWIEGDFARSKRIAADIAQRQAEMKSLQQQIEKLARRHDVDPDQANRERLAEAKARLARTEASIAAEERKFTAPDKMRAVLEELLGKNERVRLVTLKTLPVASIAEARAAGGGAAQKPAAADRLIFRHGVELVISGSYLDVLGYLSQLERLPTQLYWSGLAMESEYPNVTVKVSVFTLSLDKAWLSV
jgi:MSHA biogenesis protein MshJ